MEKILVLAAMSGVFGYGIFFEVTENFRHSLLGGVITSVVTFVFLLAIVQGKKMLKKRS